MSKALVLGAAALIFSAAGASAQIYMTPDYGYVQPVADLAPPAYGYGVRSPGLCGARTRVHGTARLCSPGLFGTTGIRRAACLRSTSGVGLLRSAHGFPANV